MNFEFCMFNAILFCLVHCLIFSRWFWELTFCVGRNFPWLATSEATLIGESCLLRGQGYSRGGGISPLLKNHTGDPVLAGSLLHFFLFINSSGLVNIVRYEISQKMLDIITHVSYCNIALDVARFSLAPRDCLSLLGNNYISVSSLQHSSQN